MSQIVQFFRYCIFHVYHHNFFVFDQNLKIKKTKFAEISALSFTFWSKSPSSFSLVAGTIQRRLHWPYRFFGWVFFVFYIITPLFFIRFQILKKQNSQKFLLFLLLIGQKVLARIVQKIEPIEDARVQQWNFPPIFPANFRQKFDDESHPDDFFCLK